MSDLASLGGFEGWVRSAGRRLETLERKVGRGRVPRLCTSTLRPAPGAFQPGVRLFETDTNRSIFVNAAQNGWVDASGHSV